MYCKYIQFLICFILVRHTNNIIKDKTTPSSVTVEVFTTSILNTLTCFGPYRPSSEGHRYSLETTITMGVLNVKIYTHTMFIMHNIYKIQSKNNTACHEQTQDDIKEPPSQERQAAQVRPPSRELIREGPRTYLVYKF